jgi:hypothetical protein
LANIALVLFSSVIRDEFRDEYLEKTARGFGSFGEQPLGGRYRLMLWCKPRSAMSAGMR